jgi:DNA polymerase III gamma/tau subunit
MTTPFHTKYRPATLDEVIGHSTAVTTLRGYVKSGKFPSAIALFGPTSVGKTTLARAFAASVLGSSVTGNPDYTEVNGSSERSIEDMRALIASARLRPTGGVRRFIVVDEAQGVLGNQAAAAALLVPIERPVASTTWILGSMDPEKFASSSNGKALLTRCAQFHLTPPGPEDMMKQLSRIRKGEDMRYVSRDVADTIVQGCGGQMRTLANMMESLAAYHEGLDEPPATLAPEDVQGVLNVSSSQDEERVVRILVAVYAGAIAGAQKEIIGIADGFGAIGRMLSLHWAVFNNFVLKGARHPAVWMTRPAVALYKQLTEHAESNGIERGAMLARMASVQASLTELKARAQMFAVPELMAISAWAVTTAKQLKVDSHDS